MTGNGKPPVVRFAPSPTGPLHMGGARTALFNFLFARRHGGKFLLRLEDTDKKRSDPIYEKDILENLSWLGIAWDGLSRQSERVSAHESALKTLLRLGAAYEAEENEEKTGNVIRFKNPKEKIVFHDIIRGDISVDTADLGDFVIAKDMRTPLYHLAVVVDDADAGVTHIIRGEDHISNTPRQILIARALSAPEPHYAHIPLILSPGGGKMSKRNASAAVSEYKKNGYLASAIVNFLALLGWHPADNREIFTPDELIGVFDLHRVQRGGAVFDEEKLDWINKEHIALLGTSEKHAAVEAHLKKSGHLRALIAGHEERVARMTPVVLERIAKWGDITDMAEAGEWDFFFALPEVETKKLVWKKGRPGDVPEHLRHVAEILSRSSFESPEAIKEAVWPYAEEKGRGDVLWPFRYALSGREKSPDPFTIAYVLGREETIHRLEKAASLLQP